jgi:PHD/YefM family antitoxin component YafN of YafNO toxin-antitoxin module
LYKSLYDLYYSPKTTLTISELRADISQAVKSSKKAPVTILKHGETVTYLLHPSLYEEMMNALEELEDIAAYDKAKARKEDSVLWSEARKDLGLA